MNKLPFPARLLLLAVLVASALLLGTNIPAPLLDRPENAVTLAVFVVALVIAIQFPVEASHTTKYNVGEAIGFLLILTQSTAEVAWVVFLGCAVAGAISVFRRGYRWFNAAFNVANVVIAATLSSMAYRALNDGAAFSASATDLASLGLATVVHFLSTGILITAMVGLTRKRQDTVGTVLRSFVIAAPHSLGLVALGSVAALAYNQSPAATLILAVPLAVVYFSLKTSLTVRSETKRAIESLATQIDQRDPYTANHSVRVAEYALQIASEMKLSPGQVDLIVRTARIHDIGKLRVPYDTVNKPGQLTDGEREEMQRHPTYGAELMAPFGDYRSGKDFVMYHHERYDGSGYPFGLKGEAIPLGAAIIAVGDAFDAMTSARPYRKAMTVERAIIELNNNCGTQFDPRVVEAFLKALGRNYKGRCETKPAMEGHRKMLPNALPIRAAQ